jgi:formylglycine-generating enzyme required for sulfatase activity
MRLRALCLLFVLAAPAWAQLLLPTPELRAEKDCPDCPELVILPDGLFMSRAPVTRAEFEVFVKETGFRNTGWGCKWPKPGFPQTDRDPVVCITYHMAELYVDWLSKRTGRAYRLPTMKELTYAAMGFEASNYWWGQSIGRNRANCTGCGSPYDGKGTSPVDTFPPNPFNLLDAVGNVWIWTTDCTTAECTERKLAGGGWSSPPSDLRIAKSISNAPDIPFNTYGLRVVREGD